MVKRPPVVCKPMRYILPLLLLMATTVHAQQKTVDCYCTDSGGSRVELGETICLDVNGRMFMAQCQMSLNNPMWREVAEGCLSSLRRAALSQVSTRARLAAKSLRP